MDVGTLVARPVWRTYLPAYLSNAAAHVHNGGHAVIRDHRSWRVVLPCDPHGTLHELGAWTLMDLGVTSLDVPTEGLLADLVVVRIPSRLRSVVTAWCERDAGFLTSTVTVTFDCRACGACCRHNRVVLEPEDLDRWRVAGRDELTRAPYVRTSRGATVLRVLRGGDCVHLAGNDCAIYPLRPDNCRDFPPGSEPCLAARAGAGMDLNPPG